MSSLMPNMRIRKFGSAIGLVGFCVACGASPTQPSSLAPHCCGPLLLPICAPEGSNVRCTAWFTGEQRDVTADATWEASSTPVFFNLSTVVTVIAPGLFAPRGSGNIVVRATYRNPNGSIGVHESLHGFAVSPATPAAKLASFISGSVVEVDRIHGIAGARVEIIDGPDGGKSTLSDAGGHYEIDYVAMGVPFMMRASKMGYVTNALMHDPIVDVDGGLGPYPSAAPIQFQLLPQTGGGSASQ